MFDKIVFISDHAATIKLKDSENITMNLMNLHLVFEDDTKKVLGEVSDVNGDTVSANFLGEIVGDRFLGGTIRKPRLDAKIRVINDEEILLITGKDQQGYMALGNTPFYEGVPVYLDVNNFFSGHFAIMGNSGSGKSCGISRLFQNMFWDQRLNPFNANIIMLDSSGEYYNAFSNLNTINPNYHYRFISTNENNPSSDKLRIPIYLLNDADLALLLQATTHSQLPIIERMRKLALVFSQKDMDANNYKNHLIAKAIMTILYTNETAPNKRNEIFSVLASCSTPQFNLEAVVQGIGYTRKFRECFLIDNSGNFTESVLITEYVSSFIDDKLDSYEPSEGVFYNLDTLEKALNFTLISEGWLRNKNTYGDAVTIKVRLHSLIVSNNAKFFDVKDYMTISEYLTALVNDGKKKYQFVNINLDDVDDDFAKVITKIYSRLIFDFSKSLTERASIPFHIIVEEAHRYIQNDNDRFLIGYNIFERIAKEGRKYGVILGIITQRPVELSDTVISQCSNFLIFKMNHPVDVEYIRKMVPNISDEIVEKQKNLQSGTCLGFGGAFRIPMIVRMEMPNPAPWSGNCDVVSFWGGGSATGGMTAPSITSGGGATVSNPFSGNSEKSSNATTNNIVANDLVVQPPTVSKPATNVSVAPSIPTFTDTVTGSDVVEVETTDNNVSLVNFVNDSANNNDVKGETISTDVPTLVAFNTDSHDSGASKINQNSNLNVDSSNSNFTAPTKMGMPNLVSFNEDNSVNNMSVDTIKTVNNVVSNSISNPNSNVVAAPQIEIPDYDDYDTGADEYDDFVSSEVNFVSDSGSSNLTGGSNIQKDSVSFPQVDIKGIDNNQNNGGFVPNIPKDMNFGDTKSDDSSDETPLSFKTGNSLVSFLDQM